MFGNRVCVFLQSCTQADKKRPIRHIPEMLHEATHMMLDWVLHLNIHSRQFRYPRTIEHNRRKHRHREQPVKPSPPPLRPSLPQPHPQIILSIHSLQHISDEDPRFVAMKTPLDQIGGESAVAAVGEVSAGPGDLEQCRLRDVDGARELPVLDPGADFGGGAVGTEGQGRSDGFWLRRAGDAGPGECGHCLLVFGWWGGRIGFFGVCGTFMLFYLVQVGCEG